MVEGLLVGGLMGQNLTYPDYVEEVDNAEVVPRSRVVDLVVVGRMLGLHEEQEVPHYEEERCDGREAVLHVEVVLEETLVVEVGVYDP